MRLSTFVLGLSASVTNGLITFEGRIPASFSLADFDNGNTSAYSPTFDLGQGLKWSDVLAFPSVHPSPFDQQAGTKAISLTITDQSIFAPSSTNVQTGFRRAELLPEPDSPDTLFTGVRALHFSLRTDPQKPLNYSHEYQLVFQEDAAFSTNQFVVKTGTLFGEAPDASGGKTLLIQGNQKTQPAVTLFQAAFTDDTWHNFAISQDFDANTTQIFYSTDSNALSPINDPVANDNSGKGQYHFGLLKKPTGDNLTDITKQGFQESGIDETILLGGIFQEDGNGFLSALSGTAPAK